MAKKKESLTDLIARGIFGNQPRHSDATTKGFDAPRIDPEFLELKSASETPYEPPVEEVLPKKNRWKPRHYLERWVNAPVIPFTTVMITLGEDKNYVNKGPQQNIRERHDRREMGEAEHKLLYKAIRHKIHPNSHDFHRGRLEDVELQKISARSRNLGYQVNKGARFDSSNELSRVFQARDTYYQFFNTDELQDEITGFFRWETKGKPVFVSGRVDCMNYMGTMDAKLGEEYLTEHGTCLTLTRDIMIFNIRNRRFGGHQLGREAKFFKTNTPLLYCQPEIRNGSEHFLLYTDQVVGFKEVNYDQEKAKEYQSMICEVVSELADQMTLMEEFENYFV